MTTSPTTSEATLRERVLDVVYGQWYQLGVPFSPSHRPPREEVVDPEALIWCSLEFLPTEPRLLEGVTAWLQAYGDQVIHRRLNRVAKPVDPRTSIWRALISAGRAKGGRPSEPCHGLDAQSEVSDFCARLREAQRPDKESGHPAGEPLQAPSSGLLRARDLLGSDIRHLILIYLLARTGGCRLKEIERFSKYSYRSISETAARWESAGVLVLERGYCRLVDPEPWHVLLKGQLRRAVVLNWFDVFDDLVKLLRGAARARRKKLSPSSPVVESLCREARDVLDRVRREAAPAESDSVRYLSKGIESVY